MARARLLKPGFFTNEKIVELPPFARLLFQGLWLIADREGRLEDRPRRIKMELFPADNIDVDELLDMLAGADLIIRYEVEAQGYIAIPSFSKHQTPHHREQASVIPAPKALGAGASDDTKALDKPRADPVPDEGKPSSSRAVAVPVADPVTVTDPVAVPVRGDAAAAAAAVQQCADAWTSATGQTVPQQLWESIDAWVERVGVGMVLSAIRETGANGARAWKYTNAILERWALEGMPVPGTPRTPAADPEWRDTAPPLFDPSENTPEKRAQRLAEAEARERERYTPEQLAEFEREAAEIRARHAERKAASR